MLQVLLEINDRYSLSEMAQMAIEAGLARVFPMKKNANTIRASSSCVVKAA